MSLNSFMQTTFIVRWQSPTVNKQQRRDRKLFILFCTVCRCVFTWHRLRLSRRLQEMRVPGRKRFVLSSVGRGHHDGGGMSLVHLNHTMRLQNFIISVPSREGRVDE